VSALRRALLVAELGTKVGADPVGQRRQLGDELEVDHRPAARDPDLTACLEALPAILAADGPAASPRA